MLCSLWPTQHIPDYWKQRWLVPLPKTEELTSIEDLRALDDALATVDVLHGIIERLAGHKVQTFEELRNFPSKKRRTKRSISE